MTDPRLITSTDMLHAFCTELATEPLVALDTEFIREKTYYPKLCLVQLAGVCGAKAVDPLAAGIDLSPLYALLENPNVLKVLHAGRQDLEIFYHAMGRVPGPLFDTQIAAQAAGFGESISYSELVQTMLGVRIDKASRFTDWARRPLSEKQIAYALDDVIHLRTAYEKLRDQLDASGRLVWARDEMGVLNTPAHYVTPPDEIWRKLKYGNFRPKQLAALRALAAWREQEAMRRDLPRGHVLRDEIMLEIAASLPESRDALAPVRGMERYPAKVQDALLTEVRQALAAPSDTWPRPGIFTGLPPDAAQLSEILQLLLKLRASEEKILPRMLATRDEIEKLARGERDVRFMAGWRYDLFGRYAEQLMSGALSITYDAAAKKIVLR